MAAGYTSMLSIITSCTDQLPVGQNDEGELLAPVARVDCSEQEDLSECSISRKGSCPLRNVIHLNCTGKHDQTAKPIIIIFRLYSRLGMINKRYNY